MQRSKMSQQAAVVLHFLRRQSGRFLPVRSVQLGTGRVVVAADLVNGSCPGAGRLEQRFGLDSFNCFFFFFLLQHTFIRYHWQANRPKQGSLHNLGLGS
jgi:hypothetical protein